MQQLANGETISIHAHIFKGTPGPTVYLQGNLHGPEVFGVALLLELIQKIKSKKEIKGKLIIVPCANSMAVNQIAYNSMMGRWNPQSGNNWNRIFPTTPLKNHQEEIKFYSDLAKSKNLSIESKLSAILRSLSAGADYVLDIHTTGSSNAEHLFTYPWMHKDFLALGTPIHLELSPTDVVGAFDESHVVPFIDSLTEKQIPKVATWETHHHGNIGKRTLEQRLSQLMSWLENIWGGKTLQNNQPPKIFTHSTHLYAPFAGYYSWVKSVGEKVEAGETYAIVYQPGKGRIVAAKADITFVLLSTYGITATASSEQIGWIAYDKN